MSSATLIRGQFVDTPTAIEFTRLAMERVSEEELGDVHVLLQRKAEAFAALLAPGRALDEVEADALLRSVFSTRRRGKVILGTLGLNGFNAAVAALLHGAGEAGERLTAFHRTIESIGRDLPETTGFDLGSELLHFSDPERHWMWTRWMWDPKSGKGALPLVLMDEIEVGGTDIADTYARVGATVAFIKEVGDASGFTMGGGAFATDVFLSVVYVVYMYTTLRMRMTQEFAQIMPDLGEMVRRILGVHRSPLLEEVTQ